MTTTSRHIAVVGAGGFGREIAALVNDLPDWHVIGFYDDKEFDASHPSLGRPWLGQLSQIDTHTPLAIGIGNGLTRRSVAEQIALRGAVYCEPLIHPMAWVGPLVTMGLGSVACANASITTNIEIGDHVHLNINSTVGHDSVIESFATLSPGVHVSGNCFIGEGAELGTGCVILPGIRVGANARVGAGAVVNRDVEPETTVVGIPAKTLPSR